jgi:O-antigen ligase
MSLFPLLAVCTLALLWLPTPLAANRDFSPAFFIPFIVLAWTVLGPGYNHRTSRAIKGEFGPGLWIEMGCVSVALVFAALSTINSPEPLRAFRVILPMLYGLGAMIALPRLAESQNRRMAYAMLAAGAIVLFVGLLAAQVPSARHLVIDDYRFKGFFDNANQLSLCIIVFLPLSVALFFTTRRPLVRALCLAATLILFYGLVATGAKTALAIAFVTAGLVVIYHSVGNDQLWKTVTRLAIVLAVLTIAVPATLWLISWSNPTAYEKIAKVLTMGIAEYDSIYSRRMLWEESWRLGMENPWVGSGAGTRVISVTNTFNVTHSHNVILDYFRGTGIFGGLSMLVLVLAVSARATAFYTSTLRKGGGSKWLNTKTASLYLGALGYFAGNQLSDSLSPSTSFFFWVVYSAAYVSGQAVRSRYQHHRLPYMGRSYRKLQAKYA